VSPFGRNKDDQDGDAANPQLDAEVARLQGLSITQMAAEVMTKAFSAQYDPTDGPQDAPGIADAFYPRPDFKLSDSTVHGEDRKAREQSTPGTPEYQLLVLADLVAEGVQMLEHAALVCQKTDYQGQVFNAGYITTRLGRTALERNAVDHVLSGGTL
jgi:hypothetical protein